MILKRKAISREYNIELTRLKADANKWCSYCEYRRQEGRNSCTTKYLITYPYPSLSIYSLCLKLVPEEYGELLKNYVYVML